MLIIYHQSHLLIYNHNAVLDALQSAMTLDVYVTVTHIKSKMIHQEGTKKKEF